MKEISDLLTQSLRRHGIEKQVTTARIVETAEEVIQLLLPEAAKRDVRVISLFGDTLRIACRHPAAAQEVRRITPVVLERLARTFPSRTIRELTILLGELIFQEGGK